MSCRALWALFHTCSPHIARYCDTVAAIPHIARYFLREVSTPPKWCDTPPWYLSLHRHICAIPHFATYRSIIVQYPTKASTKEFGDTIATSIARYEKYRCWASKFPHLFSHFFRNFPPGLLLKLGLFFNRCPSTVSRTVCKQKRVNFQQNFL